MRTVVLLLVEDEPLVRMFADDVLSEEGWKVIGAVNADEALTILQVRSDINLLITDVNMPGTMDGIDLAHAVDARWPGIDVIVTSGLSRPDGRELPTKARFMPKPYSPIALVKMVREVVGFSPEPIVVPQDGSSAAPVLPQALKVSTPHTGIGVTGSLAQPLPEPEE